MSRDLNDALIYSLKARQYRDKKKQEEDFAIKTIIVFIIIFFILFTIQFIIDIWK